MFAIITLLAVVLLKKCLQSADNKYMYMYIYYVCHFNLVGCCTVEEVSTVC